MKKFIEILYKGVNGVHSFFTKIGDIVKMLHWFQGVAKHAIDTFPFKDKISSSEEEKKEDNL